MHAGGHGAVGIFGGDSPEVAKSECEGAGSLGGKVVEVVEVFLEVGFKAIVILAPVEVEQVGSRFGDIDPLHGVFVA